MTYTDETIDHAARVRRGAALLDRVRPGWAREIDLATLNTRTCRHCVLGQLWGVFEDGVAAIENSDTIFSTVDLGFDAALGHSDRDFPPLTAAWRAEIRNRLEATT